MPPEKNRKNRGYRSGTLVENGLMIVETRIFDYS